MSDQIPAFETLTRFWPTYGTALVSQDNIHFNESGVAQADANFFRVFDIPFILGDPLTAISSPGAVVLSEELANKYFGSPEASMGQTLEIYRRGEARVTGVYKDLPENSHLQYKLVVSMVTTEPDFWLFNYWQLNFFHTYGLLAEGATPELAQAQLDDFASQRFPNEEGEVNSLTVWPVTAIHTYSTLANELSPHNAIELIERFVWVSILMVITACFNYINMSTALGAIRAKEIALRRVMGAKRHHLIGQFLFDTFVTAGVAFIIALGMATVGLEFLNAYLGKSMSMAALLNVSSIGILAGILALITIAAGAYPAFALSGLKPAQILQGGRGQNVKHRIRQVLVIVQFSIASALILAITVVTHQNWYIDDFSRGYEPENLVVLANLDDAQINIPRLKQQLLEYPAYSSVGASTNIPTAGIRRPTTFLSTTGEGEEQISGLDIGTGFFDTYQIPLIAGRNFSDARTNDDVNRLEEGATLHRVILNRMAAIRFGWEPQEAIGQIITRDERQLEIIGIVENAHFGSIRDALIPIYFQMDSEEYYFVTIRMSEHGQAATLAFIDDLALRLSPANQPAIRDTIESRYSALYADEQSQQQILTFFSFLVVIIACLGLFALASFIIKHRTFKAWDHAKGAMISPTSRRVPRLTFSWDLGVMGIWGQGIRGQSQVPE